MKRLPSNDASLAAYDQSKHKDQRCHKRVKKRILIEKLTPSIVDSPALTKSVATLKVVDPFIKADLSVKVLSDTG